MSFTDAILSRTEIDKLLSMRAADPVVLSLYLQVPLDPAELRGLPARAGELIAAARRACPGDPGATAAHDDGRRAVLSLVEQNARDWLGHTVAIFACGQLGLLESVALPRQASEHAVLATRPHLRPLLVAVQRSPAYQVAVVDRRHAWICAVAGEQISIIAEPTGQSVRSPGFSGWYGLEAYRINDRIIELARHHYRDTAAMLERAAHPGEHRPLVLGGHEESIPQFLGMLPASLRDRFAGSFVADPHTLTPARVRDLADPVVERWAGQRERRLVASFAEVPPGGLAATGLRACVDAVNQHAVQLLVVPDDGLVPGFACARCGAVTRTEGDCPDWGAASRAIPDLLEEMVVKTLEDGGQVAAVRNPPDGVAARLRFPLAPADKR